MLVNASQTGELRVSKLFTVVAAIICWVLRIGCAPWLHLDRFNLKAPASFTQHTGLKLSYRLKTIGDNDEIFHVLESSSDELLLRQDTLLNVPFPVDSALRVMRNSSGLLLKNEGIGFYLIAPRGRPPVFFNDKTLLLGNDTSQPLDILIVAGTGITLSLEVEISS